MGDFPNKDTQFEPGQSGNPAGRPKGVINITTRIKQILEMELQIKDPVSNELCKKTVSEIIGLRLAKEAMSGSIKAVKIILDRVEGKVAEPQQSPEEWIGEQLSIIVDEPKAKINAEKYLQ